MATNRTYVTSHPLFVPKAALPDVHAPAPATQRSGEAPVAVGYRRT